MVRVLDGVGTLARLGLAAVWLISGGIKASDPNQTYIAVRAYDLLPDGIVSPVAAAVPFLELALGALLLAGFGTQLVAVLSGVVLLAAWLVVRPRTVLSLDGLFGKREEGQIGGRSGTERSAETPAGEDVVGEQDRRVGSKEPRA